MKTYHDPKEKKEVVDEEKITNADEEIVNGETENEHEPTNEENWVDDINEEFGEEPILPGDEESEIF
jgi:hypothetical protein